MSHQHTLPPEDTGFEQHCIAYYAKIGEIKAKRARGEQLSGIEELLLDRAEVRNK